MPTEPRATDQAPRRDVEFRTQSRDAAVEFMEGLYGRHALSLDPRGHFDMRLRGFDVGRLNVSAVSYGVRGTAELLMQRDCWVFATVAQGSTIVGHADAGLGDAGVLAPDTLRRVPMSADLRFLNFRVGAADLQEACSSLLGHTVGRPLRFPEHVPAHGRPAVALNELLHRLAQLPRFDHPLARAIEQRHEEAALFELLLTWPHAYSEKLAMVSAPMPRSIERARDYLRAHAQDLPSLSAIAAAAGIGVRALTRGFKRQLGVSPMQYGLRLRLEAVRAELLDRVGGHTVTDVASRWGFTNMGDFAARYKQQFAELPSATLHRRG